MSKPRTKTRRKSKKQILEAIDRRDQRQTEAFYSEQIARSSEYQAQLAGAIGMAARGSDLVAHAVEELCELVVAFSPAGHDESSRRNREAVVSLSEVLRENARRLRDAAANMEMGGSDFAKLPRMFAFSDKDAKGTVDRQNELLRNLDRLFRRVSRATDPGPGIIPPCL